MGNLPPLPEPIWGYSTNTPKFSEDQMRAYAEAAVVAERERCACIVRAFPQWLGSNGKEEIVAAILGGLASDWWLDLESPLTNGQIYTAYIEAANQTLRPQDERIAFAFARAIEAAHGIKEQP